MERMTDEEFAAAYPMHMKAEKVKVERQAIGEFIDDAGYTLCTYPDEETATMYPHPRPVTLSINQVLAEYFDIDLKLLEAEKQAMLDNMGDAK